MNETPRLYDVWETSLDDFILDELLTELRHKAVILAVQEKQSAIEYTSGGKNPETVFERLRKGQTHAVQIYYRFESKKWCDTILKRPEGFHLIRMDITDFDGS